MPTTFSAALLAAFGALCLWYLTHFVAEDFRRFRDGSAVAAALAGELASYEASFPILEQMLEGIIGAVDTKNRGQINIRTIERPRDLVFEANVSKLGLLGSKLVESVVFVYGNVGGFRIALEVISKFHAEMTDDELRMRCVGTLAALQRARKVSVQPSHLV